MAQGPGVGGLAGEAEIEAERSGGSREARASKRADAKGSGFNWQCTGPAEHKAGVANAQRVVVVATR